MQRKSFGNPLFLAIKSLRSQRDGRGRDGKFFYIVFFSVLTKEFFYFGYGHNKMIFLPLRGKGRAPLND